MTDSMKEADGTLIEVRRYHPSDQQAWNEFVARSKNGTFLFDRRYMDYHSDRFEDASVMVYRRGRLYALLPGNREGSCFCSHCGLTYGGLIMDISATAADVVSVFRRLNEFLKSEGFDHVVYKPVPWIYHQVPAQEDLYALFNVCGARLSVRNISSVIDMSHPPKWSRDRHYGANKAHTDGIVVEESLDFPAFWRILEDNLMLTYKARPVHSLEEIQLLKSRMPDWIRLYVARKGQEMLGGTLLYVTPQVVHSQYISATPEGKHSHAIDAIFRRLLQEDYKDCRYFDFGTSNEERGRVLNESLIYQKEGFGGRGVCYDWYEWEL